MGGGRKARIVPTVLTRIVDIGGMGLFNHNSGLILILGVLYGKDDNEGL